MTVPVYPSPRPRIRVVTATSPSAVEPSVAEQPRQDTTDRIVADPERRGQKRRANKGSFGKGVCGNLRGRPKGAKGAKPIVRKALSSRVEIQTSRGSKKISLFEALVKKEVALAAEGDWRARRTVLELGKWALGDGPELSNQGAVQTAEELTDTGKAIIAWFENEITAREPEGGK